MNWGKVTAIFGGAFDPPHLGHREAVRGLFKNPGVGRVLVMPTADPPHKPSQATSADRVKMTQLVFGSTAADPYSVNVGIDLREIERKKANPGKPSYSFDTLSELGREIPSENLAFVIGLDQLAKISQWYRFPDVLGLCHWIVLERKSQENYAATDTLRALQASGLVLPTSNPNEWKIGVGPRAGNLNLKITPTEAPAASSTRIREAIAKTGEVPSGSLSPEVLAYLKQQNLYGTRKSE